LWQNCVHELDVATVFIADFTCDKQHAASAWWFNDYRIWIDI